jgi:tetratricopeptide (TPR) repeat protein
MDAASALAQAGQLEKASLCLTAAIPRFENAADLWVARALFARLCGQYGRAERFIHRALALEETPNSYLELIALRTAQKRYQEAGALQEFLRHLIAVRTGR